MSQNTPPRLKRAQASSTARLNVPGLNVSGLDAQARQPQITRRWDARTMRLLPLLALMAFGTVQTLATVQASGNPAPLNGIWALTGASEASGNNSRAANPSGQLVIVDGQLHGSYGCARFEGTLEASHNGAVIEASVLPPRAGERCLFVVRHPVLDDLNAARQYTVSQNHLVLFSKTARLTFERVGYVTPARK
ncbi:META domain-containing protein [Deinococcus sp. UYEF24]